MVKDLNLQTIENKHQLHAIPLESGFAFSWNVSALFLPGNTVEGEPGHWGVNLGNIQGLLVKINNRSGQMIRGSLQRLKKSLVLSGLNLRTGKRLFLTKLSTDFMAHASLNKKS